MLPPTVSYEAREVLVGVCGVFWAQHCTHLCSSGKAGHTKVLIVPKPVRAGTFACRLLERTQTSPTTRTKRYAHTQEYRYAASYLTRTHVPHDFSIPMMFHRYRLARPLTCSCSGCCWHQILATHRSHATSTQLTTTMPWHRATMLPCQTPLQARLTFA